LRVLTTTAFDGDEGIGRVLNSRDLSLNSPKRLHDLLFLGNSSCSNRVHEQELFPDRIKVEFKESFVSWTWMAEAYNVPECVEIAKGDGLGVGVLEISESKELKYVSLFCCGC
jgi:hypothetical protein